MKKKSAKHQEASHGDEFDNFGEFWDYDESRKFRQNVKLMQIG